MEFEFNSNDKRKIHDINYTAKAGVALILGKR